MPNLSVTPGDTPVDFIFQVSAVPSKPPKVMRKSVTRIPPLRVSLVSTMPNESCFLLNPAHAVLPLAPPFRPRLGAGALFAFIMQSAHTQVSSASFMVSVSF